MIGQVLFQEGHVGKRVHMEILIISQDKDNVRSLRSCRERLLVDVRRPCQSTSCRIDAHEQAYQLPESHVGLINLADSRRTDVNGRAQGVKDASVNIRCVGCEMKLLDVAIVNSCRSRKRRPRTAKLAHSTARDRIKLIARRRTRGQSQSYTREAQVPYSLHSRCSRLRCC